MRLRVRIAFVVAGIAVGVVGIRSLRSDRLGMSPLWTPPEKSETTDDLRMNSGGAMTNEVHGEFRLGEGLFFLLIMTLALGLVIVGVWPDRRRVSWRHNRYGWLAGGVALTTVALASLTGGWLPHPPWWTYLDDYNMDSIVDGYRGYQPMPGREWISGIAIAVGLWMIVLAVRSRRSWDEPRKRPAHRENGPRVDHEAPGERLS